MASSGATRGFVVGRPNLQADVRQPELAKSFERGKLEVLSSDARLTSVDADVHVDVHSWVLRGQREHGRPKHLQHLRAGDVLDREVDRNDPLLALSLMPPVDSIFRV